MIALLLALMLAGAPADHRLQGIATHLGCGWDGKMGASGLKYDCSKPYAAHPTLPFGTWVDVKSVKTGRHVKQMIFERGPYGKGRIIDMQKKALHYLCGKPCGGTEVVITVIDVSKTCRSYRCLIK